MSMDPPLDYTSHMNLWAFLTLKNMASFLVTIPALLTIENAYHVKTWSLIAQQWNENEVK